MKAKAPNKKDPKPKAKSGKITEPKKEVKTVFINGVEYEWHSVSISALIFYYEK